MAIRELIFEDIEEPECGYRESALGESIFAFGATIEELRANFKEAEECHFNEDDVKSIFDYGEVDESGCCN